MGYEIVNTFQAQDISSQIEIQKGAILKKGTPENRYLQLKMKNITKQIIKELIINIECFNSDGISLGIQTYTYSNLFVPVGEIWGTNIAISLDNPLTESVKISINNCGFHKLDGKLEKKKTDLKIDMDIFDNNKYGRFYFVLIILSISIGIIYTILRLLYWESMSASNMGKSFFIPTPAAVGLFFVYPIYILFMLKNKLKWQPLALTIYIFVFSAFSVICTGNAWVIENMMINGNSRMAVIYFRLIADSPALFFLHIYRFSIVGIILIFWGLRKNYAQTILFLLIAFLLVCNKFYVFIYAITGWGDRLLWVSGVIERFSIVGVILIFFGLRKNYAQTIPFLLLALFSFIWIEFYDSIIHRDISLGDRLTWVSGIITCFILLSFNIYALLKCKKQQIQSPKED